MHYRFIESHLSLDYLQSYGNGKIFIETGTFHGDTVWLALEHKPFQQIVSIEINDELYNRAVKLFNHKPEVLILHGDSIDCLKEVISELREPATFWLDAHASGLLSGGRSGGSPVLDELKLIKSSGIKDHTIFIDDRRLFGSVEWSRVKEEDAIKLLKEINPEYHIYYLDGFVEKDILCATIK